MTVNPSGSGSGRALILSPECPYPLAGGGALRTASLIEYFARRFQTDVITFREPGAADPAREFQRAGFTGGLHVINLPAHSRHLAARAARNLLRALRGVPSLIDRFGGHDDAVEKVAMARPYDICVIEHFWCAPYLEDLRPFCGRIWMDLHNIESVLQDRSAEAERWPVSALYRRFAERYRLFERVWLPSFDAVLATSEDDAGFARKMAPGVRVITYPNAAPLVARPQAQERNEIAISGNFGYAPNIVGLRWFLREIWPKVREGAPDAGLRLIGRNEDAIRELVADAGPVECTGPVTDAVSEIARARVAVAPLISGSGTRLKIIEAWAAGRAVVSTPVGAEGLAAEHGVNIAIAGAPGAFAAEILRLWNDEAARRKLGDAGRATYEQRYTWDAAWRALDQAGGIGTSTA